MKILGLDIGSYSVKAVEIDVSFGRVEIVDYFVEKIVEPKIEEPEKKDAPAKRQVLSIGQSNAIKNIITAKAFHFERLAVNLPKGWVTSRLFHFPTKDRKTIQNSLKFELEDDIPFDLDSIIHDFAILNQEGGTSTIYTGVALKSDILALLSETQMMGLDPDAVSIETWSFAHLLKRSLIKEYEKRPVCVVNIGAGLTTIHMFLGDQPVLTHTSTCAGNEVSKAIAQNYNLSFSSAEKAKIEGAFLLTSAHEKIAGEAEQITEDQKKFSDVIAYALIPMVREVKQTMMSYKSQYKLAPRSIFITGGTSLIPNIQLYLEEQLKIPVFHFNYMTKIVGQSLQISENSESQISVAMGLALSQVKVERNFQINFRKEELSKGASGGLLDFQNLKRPLKYVAASIVFVYLNLIAQGVILSSRSQNHELSFERSIKGVLGPVSPSVMSNFKASPSSLKNSVEKEISKYKKVEVAPTKPTISALDVLNKVSASMPRDMTLDVSYFQIKQGKMKIKGQVDKGATATGNADRIYKTLLDSNYFAELFKDKVETDPKTKKLNFEFSAKMAEASSVKNK